MRFGTFYFFQPSVAEPRGGRAPRARADGVDGGARLDQIWLTEHHFIDYGLAVDPGTLAAVAASRTRHVRIGLARRFSPSHHPLRLASKRRW